MRPPISIYDKINYYLLITNLILGVILYDFIGARFGFTYIDEIFTTTLLAYSVIKRKFSKEFSIFIGIALFYLAYSFAFPINKPEAIWIDFFIEVKPYIAFYCAYNLGLYLSPKHYKQIRTICVLIAIAMIPIGILGEYFMYSISLHPSRYATISAILGTLYFYCSPQNKHTRNITFLIWCIGLLSLKAKFFGFFTAAIFLFFFYRERRLKLSMKSIVLLIICFAGIIFAAWEKISYYFITGMQAESMFARPYLYVNSIKVLNDYIPFGSGFGSYATYASSVFYSPLYFKYKMYLNYEIGNNMFISDTFYPTLAQFGYVGVTLFIIFWYRIYQKGKSLPNNRMILLIIIFFFIESTSDSTFTQNRGIYMLVLLAMFLNQNRYFKALHRQTKTKVS